MFTYLGDMLQTTQLLNQTVSSTGVSSSGVDISGLVGPISFLLAARAGGTNTATPVLEHSADNSTWATVPAAAIMSQVGAATTLTAWSTSASRQELVLNRELLRRYVRLTISGTTLTQEVYAELRGLKAQTQ